MFRNSLLACFAREGWTGDELVALLNSSLIRWLHYHRFRDARQAIMPQVKIGHLRSIPWPEEQSTLREHLGAIGARLSANQRPLHDEERAELDELTFALYALDPPSRDLVRAWHRKFGPLGGASLPWADA